MRQVLERIFIFILLLLQGGAGSDLAPQPAPAPESNSPFVFILEGNTGFLYESSQVIAFTERVALETDRPVTVTIRNNDHRQEEAETITVTQVVTVPVVVEKIVEVEIEAPRNCAVYAPERVIAGQTYYVVVTAQEAGTYDVFTYALRKDGQKERAMWWAADLFAGERWETLHLAESPEEWILWEVWKEGFLCSTGVIWDPL